MAVLVIALVTAFASMALLPEVAGTAVTTKKLKRSNVPAPYDIVRLDVDNGKKAIGVTVTYRGELRRVKRNPGYMVGIGFDFGKPNRGRTADYYLTAYIVRGRIDLGLTNNEGQVRCSGRKAKLQKKAITFVVARRCLRGAANKARVRVRSSSYYSPHDGTIDETGWSKRVKRS